MVNKSKAAATLDEAPEVAVPVEEAPAADAPPAAEADADKTEEKTEEKKDKKEKKPKKEKAEKKEGEEGVEETKKKPTKKVVPTWATLTDDARSKLSKKGSLPKPKVQDAIIEAIKICGDSKGAASASSIKAMIMSDNPDLPKMVLKKGMAKAVERGLVAQVKGKGFSGSFKLGKGKPVKAEGDKKATKAKKGGKEAASSPKQPLEELFPHVFTWACNPKEASVGLIKKYLVANYPDLELGVEMKQYRKALELAEKNGTLERLTGKGFSGTFQLVDGANKGSGKFDDAFENACIAMNEPKDLSVGKLRDYLGFYHAEYNTDNRPKVLKRALERAVDKGWLNQISGKGFTGTFRLMHPYYPGPRELWGKDFVEAKEAKEPRAEKKAESPKKKAAKRAATPDSDDDDSDEEEEYKPKAQKRGAPTARKAADAAPKKKAKTVVAKKSKPAKKESKAKPVVAKKSKPVASKGRGRPKKQ